MKLFAIIAVVLIHQTWAQTGSSDLIAKSSNEFANKLYQRVSAAPGNVLVCPLSLHLVLALVHQGASGTTAAQLTQQLALTATNLNIKRGYKHLLQAIQDESLKIATRLYTASDVQLIENYESDAKEYYFSGVEKLNFNNPETAAKKMNEFVEDNTNHKIKNIISPSVLNSMTRMVVINAVHFQASWKYVFSTAFPGNFRVNKNKKVQTKMMSQKGQFQIKHDPDLDARILKMDYEVDGYSMLIVLPNKEDGLPEVEARLANINLQKLMEGLRESPVEVIIPKFSIEQTIDISAILKQMGITELFTTNADLRNVAQGENLHVSQVVQKTFINVHENGTEAAATTVLVELLSAASEHEMFFAGSPFHFYLIHDKTPELVLFEGRLVDPQIEQPAQKPKKTKPPRKQ